MHRVRVAPSLGIWECIIRKGPLFQEWISLSRTRAAVLVPRLTHTGVSRCRTASLPTARLLCSVWCPAPEQSAALASSGAPVPPRGGEAAQDLDRGVMGSSGSAVVPLETGPALASAAASGDAGVGTDAVWAGGSVAGVGAAAESAGAPAVRGGGEAIAHAPRHAGTADVGATADNSVSAASSPPVVSAASSPPVVSAASSSTASAPCARSAGAPSAAAAGVPEAAFAAMKRRCAWCCCCCCSCCKNRFFVVLDLASDRVRSRYLTISIFAAIFSVIMAMILVPILSAQTGYSTNVVGAVALLRSPPSSVVFGQPMVPPPVALVTALDGVAVPGVLVRAVASAGALFGGALEPGGVDAARWADVLSGMLVNAAAVSDANGLAVFTGLAFAQGPGPGAYELVFAADGLESEASDVSVASYVAAVEVLAPRVQQLAWESPTVTVLARALTAAGRPLAVRACVCVRARARAGGGCGRCTPRLPAGARIPHLVAACVMVACRDALRCYDRPSARGEQRQRRRGPAVFCAGLRHRVRAVVRDF